MKSGKKKTITMSSFFSIMRITILMEGRLIWTQPLTFKRNFNTYR